MRPNFVAQQWMSSLPIYLPQKSSHQLIVGLYLCFAVLDKNNHGECRQCSNDINGK